MPYTPVPSPRRQGRRVRPSEQGIIVLGPLIVLTVAIIVLVVAGKLLYRNRWPYEVERGERELRRAAGVVEVRYGAVVTDRLAPGEAVWVRPMGNGEVAVFAEEASPSIVGFAPDSLLAR